MPGIEVKANCRGKEVTILRKDLDEEDGQDPNFFDSDYTVAGATGFTIWDGAWSLIKQVDEGLYSLFEGKKVLEMGSGTGLAGLCIASTGSHVMLTDLQPVVEDVLKDNIQLNRSLETNSAIPKSLWGTTSIPVGDGTASAKALNWCKPLTSQLNSEDLSDIAYVVASEVVWLKELVEPFCQTLTGLLELPSHPTAIVVCRDRATDSSKTFAHLSDVTDTLTQLGCYIELISSVMGVENAPTSTFRITKK
eukprot:TRINITY_DN20763_c0_g1_i1.p1 TRINITY_DN20763_c0_g1~~TRINITY_DN20763_c0_g1_i1.p1  ORF type:complete len:250 (+),score=47.17 TRINITY_DN20763_c0_g1_i1:52-801(+)